MLDCLSTALQRLECQTPVPYTTTMRTKTKHLNEYVGRRLEQHRTLRIQERIRRQPFTPKNLLQSIQTANSAIAWM